MSGDNYAKIVDRIARAAGVEKEEIERKVEAKRAKLSNLISREGAAQIIAAELGINFDSEKLKLNELLNGMKKVNTLGKVIRVFPIREFERQGKLNKVANLMVADETSSARIVLWDMHHIELIEKGKIAEGIVIEVTNGSVRGENEVHLGSFSELKISSEQLDEVKETMEVREKPIHAYAQGANVKTRAFIVAAYPPKVFESKKNPGEKGVLMNVVLDDGTETIRSVCFNEIVKQLGVTDPEDAVKALEQQAQLLGKEMVFTGSVRQNTFFQTLELTINSAESVDPSVLLKELEA